MREKLLKITFAIVAACMIIFVIVLVKTNISNSSNKAKLALKAAKAVKVTSPYKKYGYNIEKGLSKYENTLKKTTTKKVKIYCIGESLTLGEFSSDEVNNSWVGVMKLSLQNQYGNAGEGFISIYEGDLDSGTKPRWALGKGWSVPGSSRYTISNVGGFGGCYGTSNKTTSSATLTFTGTGLDLLYSKAKDGGTASVTIDGAEVGTINCLDEELSFSNKASYSGLSNSTHKLVITPYTTSNIYIEGAIASSNKNGVEVDKMAISSKRASYYDTDLTKKVWDNLPAPDLVILCFGLNESGHDSVSVKDYKASMVSLVTYWKGRGINVCIVPNQKPADSWTTNWSDYVTSMYEISDTYNTGIIDIYKAYSEDYNVSQKLGLFGLLINDHSGGSGTNAAHPSDKGYKYIGDVIYNNLN